MAGQKESHNYHLQNSNSYRRRPHGLRVDAAWYTIYLFLGIIVGIVAFVIDQIEEYFTEWRNESTDKFDNRTEGLAWLIYTLFGILYVGVSAVLTVYVGPGAVGSGTAEMMGYTNGVRYPNFLGIETLLVKIFGVALAVSGGLHIGKEGPLAHIGSNIGAALIFFPTHGCNHPFRNEQDLRKVIAAGAGVGVAVAFASPIGGTIFAYEVTRPHVYWSFTLLLKTFWASSLATFVLNIFISLKAGQFVGLANTGLIKFGRALDGDPFRMEHLPFVIISGVICGILGAIFVWVNVAITRCRMKVLDTKIKKVIEAIIVVIITATIIFVLPYTASCIVNDDLPKDIKVISFNCPEGYFNKLATLLWQTEGDVIKVLFSQDISIEWYFLIIFFLVWYILTMVTYGTAVPAGLFFPGILMGCALGLLLGDLWNTFLARIPPTTYAIACASGILCGYSRLSLSLTILVIETTQNIALFLPVLLNTLAALWIGELFNKSLYVNAVNLKGIPFLPERVPSGVKSLEARDIMNKPVTCFKELETVEHVYKVLDSTTYHGYPILNARGYVTGLISRNEIIIAIQKKLFARTVEGQDGERIPSVTKLPAGSDVELVETEYQKKKETEEAPMRYSSTDTLHASLMVPEVIYPFNWYDFNVDYQSTQYNHQVIRNLADQYRQEFLDMRAFMMETPPTVPANLEIQRVLDLFRRLSLRHLIVIEQFGTKIVGIITRKDFTESFKRKVPVEKQNELDETN